MIKLLLFSGTCSFATFLAAVGERILPIVRFVRVFEHGGVVCFLDLAALDDAGRDTVRDAVQAAHAVEPITLDHDVAMAPAVLAFLMNKVGIGDVAPRISAWLTGAFLAFVDFSCFY
jgi:hypothetical protein